MIKEKTVLILGAGASMPFGFPSGQGLVDIITHRILRGWLLSTHRNKRIIGVGTYDDFVGFVKKLDKADPPSIDIFLEAHPELHPVGKAAIAMALKPLEKPEYLTSNFRKLRLFKQSIIPEEMKQAELLSIMISENNWYQYLFYHKLWDSFDNFQDNNLSVITFNYDRSFESYLFAALQAMSPENTKPEVIAEKVKAIKIIHPHGKLGPLEWETKDSERIVSYTPALDECFILNACENIKILSDSTAKTAFKEAHEELENAKKIYFLGFGFDETNVKRLLPEHIRKRILRGTAYGLSPHQTRKMKKLGITSMDSDDVKQYFPQKKVFDFLYNNPNAILE